MATANASTSAAGALDTTAITAAATAEETTVKAAHKRYEGLLTVRTKAIKGKGAWYWAHLEPILIHCTDTGLPKAVKLRCSLCDAVFSASNPSRTASEHLKRGTCPNFSSPSSAAAGGAVAVATATAPRPISSIAPSSPHHHHSHSGRKRPSFSAAVAVNPSSSYLPLALIDGGGGDVVYSSSSTPPSLPPPPQQQPQLFSGGKEDLGALAMFEDSVKKLKSPKASPGPTLPKAQADAALSLLSDWFYESCGSVSFSSVDHPKLRAFLHHVGLPPISRSELAGAHLDARFDDARADADARVRDALFFQLSSQGWNSGDTFVSITLNLPNGNSVFRRAVFTPGRVLSKYAEEVLSDTISDLCGNAATAAAYRCVGIIADRFKSKALRDLENQNHWMVNLSCQLRGVQSLIKDFADELPLFSSVAANCSKLATFFNTNSQTRSIFHKYQLQDFDHACLLRVPPSFEGRHCCREAAGNFGAVFAMLEDVRSSVRPLQMSILDESYKLLCLDFPNAVELAEMIQSRVFWSELEAIHSLIKLIKDMALEIEAERPLIGQCLPLWEELRSKVKEWCDRFDIEERPVMNLIEKRFKKNYHPAWSAAFILDPLYLTKDASGKYLPPFKCLTPEQEKDVDKLIMRLVTREEAHIVLMELMKWRSDGLDPLYAQAVQVKQPDPMTGKMRVANRQGSRIVWETYLSEFKSLGKVASRLIFLHATSCGFKGNLSLPRWVCSHRRSRAAMDRVQKMVFIAAHAKLERRDFSNEEEKDAELFANGDHDVLSDAFGEASSV